jgi:amino-acid N-acetyltransferase
MMVEPEFELRPARTADLAAVEEILKACDLPTAGVRDFIEEAYVVAVHDSETWGVAGIEPYGRYGLLRSVAVSPGFRGRGLGLALVADRLEWAGTRGLAAVFLLTTDAAEYFERLGFSRTDREKVPPEIEASPEFESICPESAIVMVKVLESPV